MNFTDQNFPLIEYLKEDSPKDWGTQHGEHFSKGIIELISIRKELMLKKNPSLKNNLDGLAQKQFELSQQFAPDLSLEMEGIALGANVSLTDIVILNNYTDFRDIELPEEGCSTVHIGTDQHTFSGQTWDMHGSAKNYVSVIKVPEVGDVPSCVLFSLVGCVGMMGINSHNLLLGVNNINTKNAKVGIIWPILVRKALQQKSFEAMRETIVKAPVTSGHNYILSSKTDGEHWEVTPEVAECVRKVQGSGNAFHTNHCLGEKVKELEDKSSISSTTHNRFTLLTKKINSISSLPSFYSLLTDHEEYPKSICSHFENGAQDPSFTCGGAVGELSGNSYRFWRGCPTHDNNYKEYQFEIDKNNQGHSFFKTIS